MTSRLLQVFLLILVVAFITAGAVSAIPYLGFVTVPGDFNGDDLGADSRIMSEALKYSAATCIRSSGGETADVLQGRPGISYVHGWSTAGDIQSLNNRGFYYFIFENEPDGTVNPNWASEYMGRLNNSYPMIKGVNAANTVIGGNLFTFNFDSLYNYGFKNSSDMTGFHCYSNDPATGINIDAVKPVRDVMVAKGDSAKQIFLGEGWGPTRELPGCKRLFPDSDITPPEIQMLRDFVTNGYSSIITAKANYDPNWVWGVLFFTLNDNWGGRHWADRAVPIYDDQGNITSYTVDGYPVGLDIYPHFYNGGLIDINGNAKDNLMDLFPGNGLALGNSGFEYYDRSQSEAVASDWTPKTSPTPLSRYVVDSSISHNGLRSQRLTLNGSTQEYFFQNSVKNTVTPGQQYTISAWIKTEDVVKGSGRGAAIKLELLSAAGTVISSAYWSTGVDGTSDWTKVTVTTHGTAGSNRLRVTCELSGTSGRAWFDDVCAWKGLNTAKAAVTGYVLDDQRRPVQGADVRLYDWQTSGVTTNASGYFTISDVEPGVYSPYAIASGHSSRRVNAQLALGGKTRALGFSLPTTSPDRPTGMTIKDPAVGSTLELSWANPTGDYDAIRIYRSKDPLSIGTIAHEGNLISPYYDTGLEDGVIYRYTIRSVKNGVESTNTDYYYGMPSGGNKFTAYSAYPGPQWGHWHNNFGQTFVATATGSIASASCMPGFGGTGGGTELTFTIHDGANGPQIGPAKKKWGSGNSECTVSWNLGEVPVQSGRTYYLKVKGAAGYAAYRGGDVYPQGCFYIDGSAVTGSDMHSTVTITQPSSVEITRVNAGNASGYCMINWTTSAPATTQVEYGLTESYGSVTQLESELTTDHNAIIPGLAPGKYHFRVKSTRPGLPDAVSPDYTFTATARWTASIAEARKLNDTVVIDVDDLVVTAGNDQMDGFIYVQDRDRTSGIRVFPVDTSIGVITEGSVVNVTGTLATVDGERRIVGADVTLVSAQ